MRMADDAPFYAYTKQQTQKMLNDSIQYLDSVQLYGSPPSLNDELYSFAGSVIEQAKKVADSAAASGPQYEGPDPKELQLIVDGGIKHLVDTTRGDFGLYGWCPYLGVTLKKKPQINLRSPRMRSHRNQCERNRDGRTLGQVSLVELLCLVLQMEEGS